MSPKKTQIDRNVMNLIEMDANESIECVIRKHPIGLFLTYATGIFVSASVFVASFVAGIGISNTDMFGNVLGMPPGVIVISIGALLAAVVMFFTYVAGYIYQHNMIIVTSDKIAQVLYKNLIDRKVSQLSVGEIQDVTVDQRGLLARFFNYGNLVIETAGEQNNYEFTFTPYPHKCAKDIVAVHEQSIKKYGN